jgi:hypothetical protein
VRPNYALVDGLVPLKSPVRSDPTTVGPRPIDGPVFRLVCATASRESGSVQGTLPAPIVPQEQRDTTLWARVASGFFCGGRPSAHRTRRGVGEPRHRERAVVIELPWQNTEGRGIADLTALPGAGVLGEHLHPSAVRPVRRIAHRRAGFGHAPPRRAAPSTTSRSSDSSTMYAPFGPRRPSRSSFGVRASQRPRMHRMQPTRHG